MNAKLVEFLGLPGCGKSTVAGGVAERLRKKGCNVAADEEIYDQNPPISLTKLVLSLLSPANFKFNRGLFKLLCKEHGLRKNSGGLRRYLKLVKLNGNLRRSGAKYDYIVLSEGYFQVFSSIYDHKTLSKDAIVLFRGLVKAKQWKCFCLAVSAETASQRIKERNDPMDEWNQISEAARIDLLNLRNEHIEMIRQSAQVSTLDGYELPEVNSERIIGFLEKTNEFKDGD